MQFTKDSFYMALLQRLVSLNPLRIITLDGTTRPAIVVAENELVIPAQPVSDAFYIEWGTVQTVPRQVGSRGLMEMECVISYHTFGTVESGVDRGRTLGTLDMELLSICAPPRSSKRDYTHSPSIDLGTSILWTTPSLGKVSGSDAEKNEGLPRGSEGVRLERSVSLKVFFFPEVNFL
jgi:hypothetical protein